MDATFNNPGTVITGATDIMTSVTIPPGGDHYCNAALFVYEYDPTAVTISNPRAVNPSLWNDITINQDTANHRLLVLMLSTFPGQATSGPVLLLTVTPVGSSADLSACSTLRLLGGAYGQDYVTNLADYHPSTGEWESVYPKAPAAAPLRPKYRRTG